MSPNLLSRSLDSWQRSQAPLTLSLLAIMATTFVLSMSASIGAALSRAMSFDAPTSLSQPWTLLTYPLLMRFPDILGLLFGGLTLWWCGGSLERGWGTRLFAMFCAMISVVNALFMSLGASLLRAPYPMSYWLPLSSLVLAWCLINPEAEIRLYGIFPILAKWLAIAEVLIIFCIHAAIHPLLGFCALGGCLSAYLWMRAQRGRDLLFDPTGPRFPMPPTSSHTRQKRPFGPNPLANRRVVPHDDRRTLRDLNPLEWIARRRRKKQFERLMRDNSDD